MPTQPQAATAEEGDLRLADGATSDDGAAQFGRLEIYAKGGWGTVCSSGFGGPFGSFGFGTPSAFFSAESADVACRQLGFKKGSTMQPMVRITHISHQSPRPNQSRFPNTRTCWLYP